MADLRDDVKATRKTLERETVTAPALDAAVARAETQLGRLPESPAEPAPVAPRSPASGTSATGRRAGPAAGRAGCRRWSGEGSGRPWRPAGCGSRSRSTISSRSSAVSRRRAMAAPVRTPATSNTTGLRLERARSVASSLDLRGARVDEALEALGRYLDDASLAGLDQVLIIHGLGTGALRDAVRSEAASHPLVKSVRAGERGEGGDGASIIKL